MDDKTEEIKIEDELREMDLYANEEVVAEKRNFKIELALIFVLGVLLGMVVKTEAVKKVTMGFNDYKVAPVKSDYNFGDIEKALLEEQKNTEAENAAN